MSSCQDITKDGEEAAMNWQASDKAGKMNQSDEPDEDQASRMMKQT